MKKSYKFQIFKKSDKMKQNISQKVDSGRSMVEMLGVLAVIGVLSVASILGYRYAMAKWRANETVNELNIRAYDIATRFDKLVTTNTRNIEMEMGDTTKLGYPITARISPQYEDYFEMFVSNVPTDVCKELLNSQWQAPYSIFVGVEEYEASSDICEQAENVQLAYEFYKDLSDRDEIPEEVQHKIQRCDHDNNCRCGTCNTEHGLCETWCESGEVCLQNYSNPQKLKCCAREKAVNKLCCSNETSDGTCCNEGLNCCPVDKLLRDNDGNCYTCDEPRIITVDKNPSICSVCPNRILVSNKYCAMPCGVAGTVNENKTVMDTEGKCHDKNDTGYYASKVADCEAVGNFIGTTWDNGHCSNCGVAGTVNADNKLVNMGGNCYSCDTLNGIDTNGVVAEYKCQKVCPERKLAGNGCYLACPAETPLRGRDGECHDCYYEGAVDLTAISGGDCENVCANIRKEKGSFCILTQCPSSKPVMDTEGSCHSKDDTGYSVSKVADCEAVGNFIGTTWGNGHCSNCGVAGTVNADNKLVNMGGNCYSCDTLNEIDTNGVVAEYKCQKVCPERKLAGNGCYLACPAETPLRGRDGECHDCYYEGAVDLTAISGGDCEKVCANILKEKGSFCILTQCPSSKPVMDTSGSCHSKDDTGYSVSKATDCEAIGNFIGTTWGNGHCSNCGVAGTVNADNKLVNVSGNCYSCDTLNEIDTNGVVAKYKCQKVCPNRNLNGNICVRVSCSSENRLEDKSGKCHPCNIPTPVDVAGDKAKCDACIGRYMQGDYCMPEPS